ncbi:hypothetical protein BH09DEP1_BH09DEP1_2240 [soil metagenome]
MKNRLIVLFAGVFIQASGMELEKPLPRSAPAPIVNIVFGNESKKIETVFTLVNTGLFFGNNNGGAYYPQFLPINGKVQRNAFVFNPAALLPGANTYPFIFTYKGDIYQIIFSSTKLLQEKTDFQFFATIIRIASVQEKDKSAKINTVANLYFNQNDLLALHMRADKLQFYNVTSKAAAEFYSQNEVQNNNSPVKPKPKPKPQGLPVNPAQIPKPPVVPQRNAIVPPLGRAQQAPPPPLRPR